MTTIAKNEAKKEIGFMANLPPENRGRCIPVTWVSSQPREVPVIRNEDEEQRGRCI
jgi:hypothetical protein